MIILRPVQPHDSEQLEHLAKVSGPLVSTLPDDRAHLLKKIERSLASFAQTAVTPGDESYLFVLEETTTGKLLGTGGINALAGHPAPFYSFRHDIKIHSSQALNVHNRVHALTLNHDLSDHSQLCSFYICPELLDSHYPALITLGRLLYMQTFPQRFAEQCMAVLPGIFDEQGVAPFWEHVGRKFFGIDYQQVKHYNSTHEKTFIAEMMPYHPLYVSLMDQQAQDVLGRIHPNAQLQYALLNAQGFEHDKYVEIFDAGAILTCTQQANTLANNMYALQLRADDTQPKSQCYLVAIQQENDFRACLLQGLLMDHQLLVNRDEITQLKLTSQARVSAVLITPTNN